MPFTSWPLGWRLSWLRVAKYKQRRQLFTRAHLQTLDNIQIGACTGLSFAWVQRHRRQPTEGAVSRIESINSDGAFDNHNYLAGVFNGPGIGGGAGYAGKIATVAQHALGTNAGGIASMSEFNLTTFAGAVHHLTGNPGYHVMVMHISNFATSHVCALWIGPTHMVFFDPNFGEFKVQLGQIASFFLNLKAQYATYISASGVRTELEFDYWVFSTV